MRLNMDTIIISASVYNHPIDETGCLEVVGLDNWKVSGGNSNPQRGILLHEDN